MGQPVKQRWESQLIPWGLRIGQYQLWNERLILAGNARGSVFCVVNVLRMVVLCLEGGASCDTVPVSLIRGERCFAETGQLSCIGQGGVTDT